MVKWPDGSAVLMGGHLWLQLRDFIVLLLSGYVTTHASPVGCCCH